MIDLDELQKLAEEATPGEWTIEKDYHRCYLLLDEDCERTKSPLTERTVYRKSEGDIMDAVFHVHESYEAHRISPDVAGNFDYEEGGIVKTADAEFIAAANPQAVLALIERVRRAEAERDAAVAALDEAPEPEWEVQYGRRNRETGALHWLTGEPSDDWWHENQDRYEHVKRYTTPPLPVGERSHE